MKMLVALTGIVAFIFFVVWLMKKFLPGVVRRPIDRVDLGVIAQLSLGSRQRVAVIRVAERTLVIGVTEGSITTLAELETPQRESAAQKEADDPKIFADLLAWRKDSPDPVAEPADKPTPRTAALVEDEGPRLFAPGERLSR
jgi:flagellar biosynthetic protein FliO